VYYGRLSDDEPILASLMELTTSVRRWNPTVLGVGDDGEGAGAEGGATKVGGRGWLWGLGAVGPCWGGLSELGL